MSVHQGPSAILVLEQALTMDILVSAPQCATMLMCSQAPPLGPTLSALLLVVQSTSVAAPLLVPGPSFPPGTQAPITMQGLAFSPIPSTPIVFSGAPGPMQSAGVPLQSAAKPPMAGAPWLSQATPLPSAFMAPASWPMYMPQLYA